MRSVELPLGVKAESITAQYDKGVLTLKIAKGDGVGTHRIPVKTSATPETGTAPKNEGKQP